MLSQWCLPPRGRGSQQCTPHGWSVTTLWGSWATFEGGDRPPRPPPAHVWGCTSFRCSRNSSRKESWSGRVETAARTVGLCKHTGAPPSHALSSRAREVRLRAALILTGEACLEGRVVCLACCVVGAGKEAPGQEGSGPRDPEVPSARTGGHPAQPGCHQSRRSCCPSGKPLVGGLQCRAERKSLPWSPWVT